MLVAEKLVHSHHTRAMLQMDLAAALHALLRNASADRQVQPVDQPFAFQTHHGKVRSSNQDTAIVVAGRRLGKREPFLAAILCDGMGGLEHGAEAAQLATSSAAAFLAGNTALKPAERMADAIRCANARVFDCFRGGAGTVLVAVLIEDGQVILGWVGDARAYALIPGRPPELLSYDDTVATAVARIEGPAPDAMNTLLRAVGVKAHVEPHIQVIPPGYQRMILVSDGVYHIESQAFAWICRNARTNSELASRLVFGALWEGGHDNATALAVDLLTPPHLDSTGEMVVAWAEAQPRVWETVRLGPSPATGSVPVEFQQKPTRELEPRPATGRKGRKNKIAHDSRHGSERASNRQRLSTQVPLEIDLSDGSGKKS